MATSKEAMGMSKAQHRTKGQATQNSRPKQMFTEAQAVGMSGSMAMKGQATSGVNMTKGQANVNSRPRGRFVSGQSKSTVK